MQTVREDLVSALLAVDGIVAAAVEPLDGGPGTLRLELASGSDAVAVAGRGSQVLTGASVVGEDVRQAVLRAVLSAVTRRLGGLPDRTAVGEES